MSQKMVADKPDKTRTRRTSSQPAASPPRQPASAATTGDAGNMDAKLNRILVRLEGLESGVSTLKEAVTATNDAVNDTNVLMNTANGTITTITTDNATFRADYDTDIARLTTLLEESRVAHECDKREHLVVKAQLSVMREVNTRLNTQLNDMENKLRIRNVRLDGKPEEMGEDLFRYVADIASRIGVSNMARGDLSAVYRVGARQHQDRHAHPRPRTIMVVFMTEFIRNKFFFARTKLKTVDSLRGVYLNDDVTAITRKQREDYRSVAVLARSLHADVRIHTDGIVLDGTKYRLTEQDSLPSKYSLARAKTVEEGGEIYFSSEHSFLSNFSPSPIIDCDTVFPTAEHMYQSLKCKHAGESLLYERVIAAPTPLEAKRLADGIRETPEWRTARDTVMARVVKEKFAQNTHLAVKLLKTGDIKLNEATRNDHYGIGVNLHAREIADKSYRGTNMLGVILMARRSELRTDPTTN